MKIPTPTPRAEQLVILNRFVAEPPFTNEPVNMDAPDLTASSSVVQFPKNGSVDAAQGPSPRILSSAEFIAGFVPPDYLLDGILQRRFIYSLTGRTGSGKTAIALTIAASVALGKAIGKQAVAQGRVLYFAGENPDDIRMRWIALSQHMFFEIDEIPVDFISGVFKISEVATHIKTEIGTRGNVSLVVIDTSAAYFEGDDENGNVQMGVHARRMRDLTNLPGGPTVLVLCHPVKNATDDNMQPRGGGSFIAELDGNLVALKTDLMTELHHQVKFRGPDFNPMAFTLRTVTHERLKDSKGRPIPTVIASALSDAGQEELAAVSRQNNIDLLKAIDGNEGASQAALAKLLGWFMANGEPHKVKVSRCIKELSKKKLVTTNTTGYGYCLTDNGKKAIAIGK